MVVSADQVKVTPQEIRDQGCPGGGQEAWKIAAQKEAIRRRCR